MHGCASELMTLLERLELTPETELVFVGDYVDRGPHGRQVIDIVLETSQRCRVIPLLGNHESMFMDFLFRRNATTSGLFVFNGGGTTLGSYSDGSGDYMVPREHIELLRGMQLTHTTERYFFSHAGAPELPLETIDPARHAVDLLWGRSALRSTYRWSKVVVHGHSPVQAVDIQPNRINIDTGCAFNNCLSAIELPSLRVVSVPRHRRGHGEVLRDRTSRRQAVRFQGALTVHVRRGEDLVVFETLDYSPIGMLMRLVTPCERKPLAVGDEIAGVIGMDRPGSVRFSGVVARQLSNQQGLFYGVRIVRCDG